MSSWWNKFSETQYVDLAVHVFGVFAIVYVLVRHVLLERGKLQPGAFKCLDCSKACGACLEDPKSSRPIIGIRSEKKDSVHSHVVEICTVASIVGYLLYCINGSLVLSSQSMDLKLLPFAYCGVAYMVSPILIVTSKCLMYAVMVARVSLGFQGSMFAYRKRVINALYSLIVLYCLIWDALAVVFLQGETKTFHTGGKHVQFCKMTNSTGFMIPMAAVFDATITVSVVYLFASALRGMLRNRARTLDESMRESDMKSQADLYLLPLKYTVVSTVAIISSSTAWLLYSGTGASFGVPLDCVVNCAALVLMTGKWQPVYDVICSPLLRCVVRCPCVDLSEAELVKEMQSTLRASELVLSPTGNSARTNSGAASK